MFVMVLLWTIDKNLVYFHYSKNYSIL